MLSYFHWFSFSLLRFSDADAASAADYFRFFDMPCRCWCHYCFSFSRLRAFRHALPWCHAMLLSLMIIDIFINDAIIDFWLSFTLLLLSPLFDASFSYADDAFYISAFRYFALLMRRRCARRAMFTSAIDAADAAFALFTLLRLPILYDEKDALMLILFMPKRYACLWDVWLRFYARCRHAAAVTRMRADARFIYAMAADAATATPMLSAFMSFSLRVALFIFYYCYVDARFYAITRFWCCHNQSPPEYINRPSTIILSILRLDFTLIEHIITP